MVDDVPIAGDNAKSELRALAENIQNSLKKSTVEKIKVGEWLIQARQLLASDNAFGDWCKDSFPGLNRHTRQNYMNLARTFGGELFNTIDLMSDTALYLLARPGTPENIQNYFIQKAKDGENIKVKDIQDAKSKLSEIEACDQELFECLNGMDFAAFDTTALDEQRGGSQADRINAAKSGRCVVAYPFDHDLIEWAETSGRLLSAPNENIDAGAKKPFYNFWLYKNNPPSKNMVFDNYWRHSLSPSAALQRYETALDGDMNGIRSYAVKLRGYVLHAPSVDGYWHAPLLERMINSLVAEKDDHPMSQAQFWMSDDVVPNGVGVDALAEQLRAILEERADPEEIRRFIRLQSAMAQIVPVLKSYLY